MITEEHRRHLSESHMGIKRTPESIEKCRIAMKLKWKDPKYRNKVIQARIGYKHSEDEISIKLKLHRTVIYSCLHRNKIKTRPMGTRTGKIPWNKGIELSEEQKANLNMEGLNIGHPWNKGKTDIYSEECLKQMSQRMKSMTGEKAYNWKGGISYGHKTGYYSSQYKEWRKKVFERDNYICQDCGICSGNGKTAYLTAHHIKSFAKYPELKFEVSNGKTLCEECHCKVDKYRARFMRRN